MVTWYILYVKVNWWQLQKAYETKIDVLQVPQGQSYYT